MSQERRSRSIPEINAGSMADIAFLLLIFWLVTTTMDRDVGVRAKIPQKIDAPPQFAEPIKLHERNVLNIILNPKDEIMINDEVSTPEAITQCVYEFYNLEDSDHPVRAWANEATINDTIAKLQLKLSAVDSSSLAGYHQAASITKKIKEWEGYAESRKIIGDFMVTTSKAVIRFESTNGSSFGAYFDVIDQIKTVQLDLRDRMSIKHFGVTYYEMLKAAKTDPSWDPKIRAVRHRFPEKLLEPAAKG